MLQSRLVLFAPRGSAALRRLATPLTLPGGCTSPLLGAPRTAMRFVVTPPLPRRTPPPPPRSKLPPPPPLPSRGAPGSPSQLIQWKSPAEVLAMMVEYVPTFFVPINCVAAIMTDEHRAMFVGRNRLAMFFKKYRFYFEVRTTDGGRVDVMLRPDVQHPKKGAADEKYELTDVGDVATYTARAEFVTSLDSLERGSNVSVPVRPVTPPPSVHVRMEERVAVLDRLRALIPTEFAPVHEVEETIPEDVLFHPYFDCQGGLQAIANKHPDHFQLVEHRIRLRRPHLAPLATDELDFSDSPEPEVAARVRQAVTESDLAQWVSVTSLYEQLTPEERRRIKHRFRSFAGFLRAHGKCLSISHDTLQVALWTPPRKATATAAGAAEGAPEGAPPGAAAAIDGGEASAPVATMYTELHIVNEIFERFPAGRTLSGQQVLDLIPLPMRASLPASFARFLNSHPAYFIIDNAESELPAMRVRRAADSPPLDIAHALYGFMEEGVAMPVAELRSAVPPKLRDHIERVGLVGVVDALPQWLALSEDGTRIQRLRSMEELELAIQLPTKGRLAHRDGARKEKSPLDAALEEELSEPLRFEGTMSRRSPRDRTGSPRSFGGPSRY